MNTQEDYKGFFKIPLTQNEFTLVDVEDFDKLIGYKWHCVKGKYTIYARVKRKGKHLLMHRLIMNAKKGQIIDHINGNGLDNRRHNLRFVTNQQNRWNCNKPGKGKSKYVGVTWHIKDKKWQAQIRHNGKLIHLGSFENEEEAARMYDKEVIKLRGEYGRINGV